jgi:DNA-binding NarL/FixJ family response regulator
LVEVIIDPMVDSSEPGRILIADDHEIVRVGLRLIIEEWGDCVVVGEAANGKQAILEAERHNPDIIFMDVAMPVMDGIEATHAIKRDFSNIRVIMLTADRAPDTVFACLASGAQGYCLKEISAERLHAGVGCVLLGDLWLDQEVAATISDIISSSGFKFKPKGRRPSKKFEDAPILDVNLSARELEILDLIVKGLSNSEISDKLFIAKDTVKTHVSNILKKLSACDRTQAAVKALREGLVQR